MLKDNVQTGDYIGIAGDDLTKAPKTRLLALTDLLIANTRTDHPPPTMGRVRLD